MYKTIATLFSGIGGVECGAIASGLTPLWGIDNDQDVSDLHRTNFKSTVHDWDLTKPGHNWESLQSPDVLHVSPPCQNFSKRKRNGGELTGDVAIATNICQAISVLKPRTVTFENVPGYADSFSWKYIADHLSQNNYYVHDYTFWLSDWGVPQSRHRFFAIATKNKIPQEVKPIYPIKKIGEAVEDLIGDLTESYLTSTQIKNLTYKDKVAIASGKKCLIKRIGIQKNTTVRYFDQFCFTILSSIGSDGKGANRASIVNLAVDNKIYNLSVRAIARLQSFPDWYKFNCPSAIAIKGIGNAVPPVFYQQICEQINAN